MVRIDIPKLYDLRADIAIVDETLSEIDDLDNLLFFRARRQELLNEYKSIIDGRGQRVRPRDEREYIAQQSRAGDKLDNRVRSLERAIEREAPKKKRSAFLRTLRKAAGIAAIAFNSMALYDGKAAARAEAEASTPIIEMAPIYAAQPTQADIARRLDNGFWDVFPAVGVEPRINSFMGRRNLPSYIKGNTIHRGLDVHAPAGTVVLAPAAGTVEDFYSTGLTVNAGNYSYTKRHIWPHAGLKNGAQVEKGDTLGRTGPGPFPHLHIEVKGNDGIFSLAHEKHIDPLLMFNDSIYGRMLENLTRPGSYKPTGLRFMSDGSTIEEKLEYKLREQIDDLVLAKLPPIQVKATRYKAD